MPSFRSRVLEALDITKDHVRIPTFDTFPVPPIASAQSDTMINTTVRRTVQPVGRDFAQSSPAIGLFVLYVYTG